MPQGSHHEYRNQSESHGVWPRADRRVVVLSEFLKRAWDGFLVQVRLLLPLLLRLSGALLPDGQIKATKAGMMICDKEHWKFPQGCPYNKRAEKTIPPLAFSTK
jgi:hypothetical protein